MRVKVNKKERTTTDSVAVGEEKIKILKWQL